MIETAQAQETAIAQDRYYVMMTYYSHIDDNDESTWNKEVLEVVKSNKSFDEIKKGKNGFRCVLYEVFDEEDDIIDFLDFAYPNRRLIKKQDRLWKYCKNSVFAWRPTKYDEMGYRGVEKYIFYARLDLVKKINAATTEEEITNMAETIQEECKDDNCLVDSDEAFDIFERVRLKYKIDERGWVSDDRSKPRFYLQSQY